MEAAIPVAQSSDGKSSLLLLSMASRHGLIAGATGTGKTVTLQTLAEALSRAGVSVFAADVKGDLAGLAKEGGGNPKASERLTQLGLSNRPFTASPVALWDVFGRHGLPFRTTVSEMGPILLARLFDASDAQEGLLHAAFSIADDEGLPIVDLKDLRALFAWMAENAQTLRPKYGNITPQSIAAIQRDILVLEQSGGTELFGEPAIKIEHLLQRDFEGRGAIHLLHAADLINQPRAYSMLLLWLLSELFEQLPEQGDSALPKLVFFFDEAHLLFSSAPKPLLEKIEQVVRLIRSRGVGVFFVTQNPLDLPPPVAAQLGNRVQHALRAFTAQDKKAVQAAAETFRPNPALNVKDAIVELGTGEALVSFLDSNGTPQPVERSLIIPPASRIGTLSHEERAALMDRSPFASLYRDRIDRESAYEKLQARMAADKPQEAAPAPKKSTRQTPWEALFSSAARAVGSHIGRQIARGVLGSILGSRR